MKTICDVSCVCTWAEGRSYQVVHEILAHAGEIDLARDAVLLQLLASSDSRAHEDGRTAVCSSRDDDLLSRVECARRPISQLSDDAGCSEAIGTLFEHD